MRRRCLGLALAAVLLLSASPVRAGEDAWRARHVLERLGYGPAPGAIAQVQAMGVSRYIETQLHPEAQPLPTKLAQRLAGLGTLRQDSDALYHAYFSRGKAAKEAGAKERRKEPMAEAAEARLVQATESPRQLEAAMTEFWFDHFNVYVGKGPVRVWVGAYEEQALRPHALGRFRDLLGAVAHHPAMLFYLDNWRNTAAGGGQVTAKDNRKNRKNRKPQKAKPKRDGLNENYARELLELHTLGVDGGYTQADVVALARVLTGWGFKRPGGAKGDFHFGFDANRHDGDTKVLLGRALTAHGEAEVEEALDRLAAHPTTARRICTKLARFFVADDPPPALVDQMAARWAATDGDLRQVMAACFERPEFWDSHTVGAKFKSPYRYVVSALRATGTPLDQPQLALNVLRQLGMPLYGCLTPDGYKCTQAAWLSPQGMALRIGLAARFGYGDWSGPAPTPQADALAATLGWAPSEATRSAIAQARPAMRPALMLGSPEFMRY